MKTAMFNDLMTQLTNDQTPRVWSLLVTVFGELAQVEGAQISGTLMTRLTSLMGIKPEAMRVALHRLRKDGWIQSERNGRTSAYSLTDWGRSQSALATPRIYDFLPVPTQAWLVLFDPSQAALDHGMEAAWISSSMLISARDYDQNGAFASPISADKPLPDWMTYKVCSPETIALAQGFHTRLSGVQNDIEGAEKLDCFEITALRILIVDGWRRIVLKTPNLPEYVFPKDWLGQACRVGVASLLRANQRQDLDALEAAL